MTRRVFVGQLVALAGWGGWARGRPGFRTMGVAAGIARAAEVKAAGAEYLVESVGGLLMPDKTEAMFAEKLAELARSALPVKACNSFLRDKALRCVGPDADHPRVLAWAATAFRRARRAGVEFIVFGSAGARQVPDGWPMAQADAQFVALLKAMGALADQAGIIVAVEPLQRSECNYLSYLADVARVVRLADHPRIRALADLYHMTEMGETPAALAAALPVVHWVEIAEKGGRTAPGVTGYDFRPYFAELAKADFAGGITIEGRWTPAELKAGFEAIRRQARDVAV